MVRVMMIDSYQQSRINTKRYLENDEHYKVVARAVDLKEAIQKLTSTNIDLIILDSHTTRINSKRNLIEIQQQYPNVKILIMPLEQEQKDQLSKPGNFGLIFKNRNFDNVKNELDKPKETRSMINAGTNSKTLNNDGMDSKHTDVTSLPFKITTREWDVLRLILKELSNQEIAEKLFISRRTVEAHKRNLLSKTNSRNLVGLVLFAVKYDLVE